ncbi:MAG: hypothetical protein JNL47_03205 [Bacteroidia bacterium]|nr:hypothetical protein [Bacteroidia bacterium]
MKKSYPVVLFILLLCAVTSKAQQQQNPYEFVETPPVLLRKEFSAGINIHSSGWGIDFRRGRNLTVSKKRMLEIEFVGMHHPKEIKSINPYYENSKAFVFGKLNSMMVLRTAYGLQQVIATKAEWGGVEIRLNTTAGFSLGLLKPVYLNIIREDFPNPGFVVSIEKFDPDVHTIDLIYGRANFFRGFSEMKPYPGLYAKAGLSFEHGRYNDDVKIIEVGMTLDAYTKRLPIMAMTKNNQLFVNFYINILYGRKW